MPNSSPEAVPTPPAPKRARSAQDKFIEAYINDAKKFLKGTARGALRGRPGLLAKLELCGPPPTPTSSDSNLSQKIK